MLNNTPIIYVCINADEEKIWHLLTIDPKQISANLPEKFYQFINAHQLDEALSIDAIRQLHTKVSLSNPKNQERVILLSLSKASLPAQNALLKIIEQLPKHTYCVLTTTNLDSVVPTIQSRCQIIDSDYNNSISHHNDEKQNNHGLEEAREMMTALQSKKIADVIDLCEKYKNRDDARKLVRNIIAQLVIKTNGDKTIHNFGLDQRSLLLLTQLYKDLEYNVNVRLALEHYFFKIINEVLYLK